MKKWILTLLQWSLILAMPALLGCGAKPQETFSPSEQRLTEQNANDSQPPAVVEIPGAGSQSEPTQDDPEPPPQSATGDLVFTPLAKSAKMQDVPPGDLTLSGGPGELLVDGGALNRDIQVEEGASIHLILQNGASFTGTIHSQSIQDVSVTMDASSRWTLTADTGVGAIVNADTAFSNLLSQGFSLQYDSENAANAYLSGEAKSLPGNGFLSPII